MRKNNIFSKAVPDYWQSSAETRCRDVEFKKKQAAKRILARKKKNE